MDGLNTKAFQRSCPLCDGGTGRCLGTLSFSLFDDCPLAESFDVVACGDCLFVFYDTPDDAGKFAEFYREHYFSSQYLSSRPVASVDAVVNVRDNPLDILRPYLATTSSVCEVGCGRGALLSKLQREGYVNLRGVEPSADCVRFVRETYGIDVVTGTADSIPFGGGFDLMIATHVLEHVVNVRDSVQEFARKTNDAGMVYVEVPDIEGYDTLSESTALDYITFYEHINHFGIASLKRLFGDHGFALVDFGRKVLNPGTRLPLPAVYGVFRKAEEGGLGVNDDFDVSKVAEWLREGRFPKWQRLEELAESRRPVYVWGINLPVQKLLSMSALSRCNIAGLVDRDPRKQRKTIGGVPVRDPGILRQAAQGSVVVLWGGPYRDAILDDLRGLGFAGEAVAL